MYCITEQIPSNVGKALEINYNSTFVVPLG